MTSTQPSVIAPDEWSELIPSRTDRIVLVGQTGSGKTTLARYLLSDLSVPRPHRLVVDYKGLINWPEYTRYTDLKSLSRAKEPLLLYRPNFEEANSTEARERFWEWVYRRRHTTVYVDETTGTTNGDNAPKYYVACLTRGREIGIELWSATQRPTKIPQVVLSESEHVYAFKLRLEQDRERVEGLTAIDRRAIAALKKREFLYARQDSDVYGPLTLKLS